MVRILNKESGLLGLSQGLSSDFRDLSEAMENGNPDAKRAIDCLCYRIIKYIGSYVAAMNGVDAIAFTGGIVRMQPLSAKLLLTICPIWESLWMRKQIRQEERTK